MNYRTDTTIIDALLGESGNGDAILMSVEGHEAYSAARNVIEGILENEETNGPGTFAGWANGENAIEVYGLGDEFEALAGDQREVARPLIVAGIDRAIGLLRDYGHLGDKALLIADEKARLQDPDFEEKAFAAIESKLSSEFESGSLTNFLDCDANEGMTVKVNGIELRFRYEISPSSITEAAREDISDDEWEAMSEEEKAKSEREALLQTIAIELDMGGAVETMWDQASRRHDRLLEAATDHLDHLERLAGEERQAA